MSLNQHPRGLLESKAGAKKLKASTGNSPMKKSKCKACSSDMHEIDVYPARPGHDVHVIRCTKCSNVEHVVRDNRFGTPA